MERKAGIDLVFSVLGLCSAALSAYQWIRTTRGGGIALPLENDTRVEAQGNLDSDSESSSILSTNSVFDIATPYDFIDGHPLDEAAFWARMRPRKISLLVVLFSALVFSLASTGYSELPKTLFTAYLALLAFLSLRTGERTAHVHFTTSLAVLSSSAFLILLADALVPEVGSSELTDLYQYQNIFLVFYLFASALALATPRGPPLYYPPQNIYPTKMMNSDSTGTSVEKENNVNGVVDASPLGAFFFIYISAVATLPPGFGVPALPLLTADMRAIVTFSRLRSGLQAMRAWRPPAGIRFGLALLRANARPFVGVLFFTMLTATTRYAPSYFMRLLLLHLESREDGSPAEEDARWGYLYVAGLFAVGLVSAIGWGQLWSLAHIVGVNIVSQTTGLLFAKTLVRRDVVTIAANGSNTKSKSTPKKKEKQTGGAPFAHKAQILTLMSQDVHRIAGLSTHVYTLTDSVIQLVLGTGLLYILLGSSSLVGLASTVIFLPLQHFTGNIIIRNQSALMKAKDERVELTNEILGGIRMIKFMAWERNFEARLWGIRKKELARQRVAYTMKTLLAGVGIFTPLLFALVSFGHYTVVRHKPLTPSVAFTAITVFNGVQNAISGFPEALLAGLQCLVSLRRIDQYLDSPEVSLPPSASHSHSGPHTNRDSTRIVLSSVTVSWPSSRESHSQSESSTPFVLSNLSLEFPAGELSLVCGKVGSGKTLLLLALLGEAEVTAGTVKCPRSAPDFLASFGLDIPSSEEWLVQGVCAYVPQTSWLRNQSIRDNILFELPYCADRYAKTLEVCALIADLEMLEYGDFSEVGERGINLSGGQKARVSLARAVYSRASILILDDILSAVDVHTAHHIYHTCLKGDIMRGRTVILVSHHIQLCVDYAAYVVALDRGTVKFQGAATDFRRSDIFRSLLQTKVVSDSDALPGAPATLLSPSSQPADKSSKAEKIEKATGKAPKFVADEISSVGRISWAVWTTYLGASGNWNYWIWFTLILLVASLGPVFENAYLRTWTDAGEGAPHGAVHYLSIYAAILCIDLMFRVAHFLILYSGSIRASRALYRKLLETVLFSNIRFHDTVARGSLLNRFGKDFQIIDGFIADDFGRTLKLGVSVVITFATITVVGGLPFVCAASVLGLIYYLLGQDYAHTSRDMRRLVSTTTSPLYSIYDTAISGVLVVRSFGASTTFLRDLMRSVDANSCACHWQYGLNRWFSVLSMTFGGTIVALVGLVVLLSPTIDPSLAGMGLVFASMICGELMYFVRAFVGLEQCLVAVERVKETSDLVREPPEIIEPRPPANWPSTGKIICQDLSVRYALDLPNVLHGINFQVLPGEKIGVVGRTGSGKSTLALSFFRFVEASKGKLLIDDIDIASLGLTDLRRNLTIIPQDPILMSGTLRTTLDVFNKHEDAEIFEALRRVHLISDAPSVFNNLDSPVSQAGANFSAGEKQLLCLARAILRHSKVLIIDEATASVDYATDELVGGTIREKFSESTVIAIAHRLRSIIDYDKVMVLEEGRIVEFDRPRTLLEDPSSAFFAMCKATGHDEFATLRKAAGL